MLLMRRPPLLLLVVEVEELGEAHADDACRDVMDRCHWTLLGVRTMHAITQQDRRWSRS